MIDVDAIDSAARNKDILASELHKHTDDYPELAEVTTDLYRDEMVEKAREIVDAAAEDTPLDDTAGDELDREAKIEAMKNIARKNPGAVMVPLSQVFCLIEHPEMKGETYRLTTFAQDMGNDPVEDIKPKPYTPENYDNGFKQPAISGEMLAEAPEWALPQLHDLIQKKIIGLFESDEAAQKQMNKVAKGRQPMIDSQSARMSFRPVYDQNVTHNGQHPVVQQSTAQFTRDEQRAANRVLNETVQGEKPLPMAQDEVTHSPREITQAEYQHVRSRIERCLSNPEAFLSKRSSGVFNKSVFYSQLLECEMSGHTPSRPGRDEPLGGMRPQIVKLVRKLAESDGYEVLGTNVRPKPRGTIEEDASIATGATKYPL